MQSINVKTLKEKSCEGGDLLMINTLDPQHFENTHIPGSVNVPQAADSFVNDVERLAGNKEREIVVYCASDSCDSSTKAADKLQAAGFSNVADFEGGAQGWKDAGLHLIS